MKKISVVFAAALGSAGTVYAHGGHGTVSATQILHYILEPAHSLPALALVLAGVAVAVIRSRRKASPARSTALK